MGIRHSERITISLPVLIQTNGAAPAPGIIRNLSTGGLYVQTSHVLPRHAQVVVTLDLSRHRRTPRRQLAGIVVHEQPSGIGLSAEAMEESLHDAFLHCAGYREPTSGIIRWFVTEAAPPISGRGNA